MERTIFELDAIGLATEEKLDRVPADEGHVRQIQNQLLPRCLDGEKLLKLVDILGCLNSAADCEKNSTIPCPLSPQHASSPCLKIGDAAGISFLWASVE
jgi:hypothetical protein